MSLVEQWKYELCYERSNYRMGRGRLQYTAEDINSMSAGLTYLDVGCGRGETLDRAESIGLICTGIETVPDLCDGKRVIHGDACDLPFEDGAFHYVSCYDVVEHLPPGEEQQALDELRRVCSGVFFLSTNDKPSFLDGIDLHVNKRPAKDWDADIRARWGNVIFTKQPPHGDWHWRCEP